MSITHFDIQINSIKKSILKKKILLGFVIDHYSFWDKFFRYAHLTFAFLAPVISLIDALFNDQIEMTSIPTLALGTIVAAMLKLKDYLKFDKIRDEAKSQTIRYEYIYQKIEREITKTNGKHHMEDFTYWINREFNNITMSDPEISHSIKDKYITMCKSKNIPYDEDMDSLLELVKIDQHKNKMDQKEPEQKSTIYHNDRNDCNDRKEPDCPNDQKSDNLTVVYKPDQSERTLTKNDLQDKLKSFNTKADMEWVMDRLNEL